MGGMLGGSLISFHNHPDINFSCSPGRFFAANELKALLVFMVIHYDFKLKDDGPRPSNVYMDENVVPDPTAQLMFRKRQVVDIPKH